ERVSASTMSTISSPCHDCENLERGESGAVKCRNPFKSLICFQAREGSVKDSPLARGAMDRAPMKLPFRSKRILLRTRRCDFVHSCANSMNTHGNIIHGLPGSTNIQIGKSCTLGNGKLPKTRLYAQSSENRVQQPYFPREFLR